MSRTGLCGQTFVVSLPFRQNLKGKRNNTKNKLELVRLYSAYSLFYVFLFSLTFKGFSVKHTEMKKNAFPQFLI